MTSRLDGASARSNESNESNDGLLNELLGQTFEHGERRRARFSALIGAHRPVLEAVARKLCREQAAAADLLQDTLERAWRRLESLDRAERARGWLVRVMRNAWIDQLRRRRPEVPLEEAHEPPVAAGDEPPWWERITIEDLRRAIEQLEEPYRRAAVLRDLDGHSYREIARRLDIPDRTAATRIHRAHAQIRELLQRRVAPAEHTGGSPW